MSFGSESGSWGLSQAAQAPTTARHPPTHPPVHLRPRLLRRRPQDGNWSDVSGENFLRTLLTKPVEEISGSFSDEDDSFLSASPVGGDPRALAQRIMDLR